MKIFKHGVRHVQAAKQLPLMQTKPRLFSEAVAEVQQEEPKQVDIATRRKELGIDSEFSEQKHGYILTFPWNFPEIVNDFERQFRPMTGFWDNLLENSNAKYRFSTMFRDFHQSCALNERRGLDFHCERRLADYVDESLKRIHLHGLDVEMANVTNNQPRVDLLKVEIHKGLSVDRSQNLAKEDYTISSSKWLGADYHVYTPKRDERHFLDHLQSEHKPFLLAATVLIESPMKLHVMNQDYSAVLFGSQDQELVKNIVRFEANVRWLDFYKFGPFDNKMWFDWKLTDFNHVLNQNPYF